MNYLFIDIECANCKDGGKLCEFGYVLTDLNFSILMQENLLINPDTEFDPYVLYNMLNYKKEEYDKSPLFSTFYNKILSLLTDKNNIAIGHTIGGDAVHIGDDCIRYGFDTPDFEYYDVVDLYREFTKTENATSLVKMCAELNIETGEKVHSADVDAYLTMQVFKSLCEKKGVDGEKLIKDCPSCRGVIKDYAETVARKKNYNEYFESLKNKGIKIINKEQFNVIRLFRRFCGERNANHLPFFKGKSVCISENYERTHYNQILVLIQKLKNAGAKTVSAASKCDIFVYLDIPTKDGKGVYCKKQEEAKRMVERGKQIEFIEFNKLLELLSLTKKDLYEPISKSVEKFIKYKTKNNTANYSGISTIGEIIDSKSGKN